MYIITLIDRGALVKSAFCTTNELANKLVISWYKEHYSSSNDVGYIAVDFATIEGEVGERAIQVHLDEEEDDVILYLNEQFLKFN